jgi:hypothetical protein
MRISPILLLAVTILSGCQSNSGAPTDIARTEIPQVSVPALLARAGEFDGQPVRVVGFARFDRGPEGRSAVYATATDLRRSTSSFITIGSFSPGLSAPPGSLEKLTGKNVLIEATFRARPLNTIPQRPGLVVACVGECRTSGLLEDVTRVNLLLDAKD